MSTLEFSIFDTALGRCAIVCGAGGVLGVQLPERNDERLRSRIARRFPDAEEASPALDVRRAIERIAALLAGQKADLSGIRLDMSRIGAFERRVYEAARRIPPGETATYGEIAEELGDRALARDVGQAMGRNPYPIIVPCHRVVAAGGKLGGFSARGGADTKLRMLAIEGAAVNQQIDLFGRAH